MTTQKHSKIKNCIKCNIKLIEGLNWWKSRKNSRNYICNKCDWKSSKPRMQKYIELGYDIKWSKLKNKIIGVKPCITSSD